MPKINKITTDGNNNITLQDVKGENITINVNGCRKKERKSW